MKGRFNSRSDLRNRREEEQDKRTYNVIRNLLSLMIVLCIATLLLFGMSGCRTKKVIEYRDSVRIEYQEILVPDTVVIEVPEEAKERETPDSTSFLETSMAESLAKMTWKGGIPYLFHSLKNKPQKIKKVIYTKQKIKTIYRTRYVTRTEYKTKELTWWQKTRLYIADVGLMVLGLWIIIFIIKKKRLIGL
jgi:hypothetical protein